MFPNDDELIESLFSGHDSLLEDVRGDFSARLGETEMRHADFIQPDTNPTIIPLLTNYKDRWKRIRPSLIPALQGISQSVCGDEVIGVLKRFDFQCMEDVQRGPSRSLSFTLKGRRLGATEATQDTTRSKMLRLRAAGTNPDQSTPLESLLADASFVLGEGRPKHHGNGHEPGQFPDEKPGTVCSECGRTVTHAEYSSGQPICCKSGSVVPEEEFGQPMGESKPRDYEDCGKTKRHRDGRKYDNKEGMTELAKDSVLSKLGDQPYPRVPKAQKDAADARVGKSLMGFLGRQSGGPKGPSEDVVEALLDQFASTGHVIVAEEEAEKSCWGCGDDWKYKGHEHQDLIKRSSKYGVHLLCPTCYPEEGGAGQRDDDGSVKPGQKHPYSESVAPGYLIPTGPTNNGERPDGRLTIAGHEVPHAALALQDLHRRLGSALPELHGLTVSTITDERTALSMLFHELHTAHCDIGNVLSYTNQIPDQQMSEVLEHYTRIVSQMMAALNPFLSKNPAVSTGPYRMSGSLHDSEGALRPDESSTLRYVRSRLGEFKDIVEMLEKYNDFATRATRGGGKTDLGLSELGRLRAACSSLIEDQSWYQPKQAGAGDFDWSYGKGKPMAAGQKVRVNMPGHQMHGVTSRIVRQQSNQFAVENPASPGKVEFFGAHQLEDA